MDTILFLLHNRPFFRFIREALTMRTALISAGFLAFLSLALAIVNSETVSVCLAGESRLMYPVYNKRGVIIEYEQRCGAVHRGCTERTDGTGHDCSPFMAPKGTLSQR